MRHKNETSFLTPLDPGLGQTAIFQVSRSATLVGLEAPESRRPIDITRFTAGRTSLGRAGRAPAGSQVAAPTAYDTVGGSAADEAAEGSVIRNVLPLPLTWS